MIKHLGEGLTPFEDCGFARYPETPLVGENVQVRCRLDPDDEPPLLTICGADGERTVRPEADGRFAAYALGSFDRPQHVRYRLRNERETTPWYRFDVVTEETLRRAAAVCALPDGSVCLTLAPDVTLTLAGGDCLTATLEQQTPPGGGLGPDAVDLGGCTVSVSGGGIWELKRSSTLLCRAEAIVLRRDCDGRVTTTSLCLTMNCRHFFGTGERFDRVDQYGGGGTGRVTEKFTHQGAQTYLPVPFFFTEQGFGWYRAGSIPADLRLGARTRITAEAEGTVLARDVLLPGSPAEILRQYLRLTGPCALPPAWAFGVWISGNGWNCDAEVEAQLAQLKRFSYPASVLVLEQWSDERTFRLWHKDHWRDPAALVRRVREAGLHLVLWQIPVIKREWDGDPGADLEDDEREAVQRGYVVRSGDGSPYRITENWFRGSLLPDFTNPAARAWWFGKRRYLLDMGVEGFKTDGGEFLFEKDATLADGTDGRAAHNLYPLQYARAYHDFLRENGVDGVTFSRAGFAGAQSVPIHWAGDQKSEWSELRAQLCAGLSAGLSGVLFWSFDIGGFAGKMPTAELYLRATAMGCFSPVMQWHSEPRGGQFSGGAGESFNNDRSPWNVAEKTGDPQALTVACFFARLREKLRPYLWREAQFCADSGRPLMAHLCLDFPGDERAWATADEYMLGRDLLVAPVTEEGRDSRAVYLPAGTWRDYFTGETREGGRSVTVPCPLDRIPVYERRR